MSDLAILKVKTVLVTGGASGIGLAISTRFARAGANVFIADKQREVGHKVVGDLTSHGHNVTFAHCDVQDYNSCVAAFKQAAQHSLTGTIDVVALMAGVLGDHGSLVEQVIRTKEQMSKDDIDEQSPPEPKHTALDVNLLGVYNCAYLALWYMSPRGPKGNDQDGTTTTNSLILIGSIVSYIDAPLFSDYQTSKFGVRGLFRTLRYTTPSLNIRLNMLAPTFVRTPLVTPALPVLKAAGMGPGHGLDFVDVETVVDAAVKFAVDDRLHGRAWAVVAGKNGVGDLTVDLQDDEHGSWGGEALEHVMQREEVKETGPQ
ncbi:hypothetical protein A1O1_01526 [Capronia coronata CBS 617.96]|uniref:NAD(P)-binding protein n=1 Tax=Capronia coronata CBS 617.96 TaxID=1182541 RepID=W9Z380_9EURO|nr:uncharacterized protein A1O1_01526 [Capronia coronata CBS 617.96]EXJ96400.1 hypothetical protein A1O1_01526 [Capronia coronata CBS 617.96]